MTNIEKLLGEGAIPSPRPQVVEKKLLTTGFLWLDKVLGGGIPKGSIVEILGDTGKTTLALGIMAEHPQSLYINCDYAFDEYYASIIGVKEESLIVNPTNLFSQLNMAIEAEIPLIIVDSAAGIVTDRDRRDELEYHIGSIKLLNKNSVIIFTNQFRWNGEKTVSCDNYFLKRNSDIRLLIDNPKKQLASLSYSVKVLFNRYMPSELDTNLMQYIGEGFSKEWDLINYGITHGHIEQNGAFLHYTDNNPPIVLGRGLNQAVNYLKREPEFYKLVKERMRWEML